MDRRADQGVALEGLEELLHVLLDREREPHPLDCDAELGLSGRGDLVRGSSSATEIGRSTEAGSTDSARTCT